MRCRCLIVFVLFFALRTFVLAQESSGKSKFPVCAVVGFVNELKDEQWRDARIGMGVRAMLTQAIHETGLFGMLEEKEAVTMALDKLVDRNWKEKKDKRVSKETIAMLASEGAGFIASGRVYYFGKPRTRTSVGPVHISSDEVILKLEVKLYDIEKKKTIAAIGSGKAKTTATSALFTFHGEKLDADKSMVATATRKAITLAVDEIMKKYRKEYKPR